MNIPKRTWVSQTPENISDPRNIFQVGFQSIGTRFSRKLAQRISQFYSVLCERLLKILVKIRKKTFTGYIKLKLSELSAVRLQPSMDKKWKR